VIDRVLVDAGPLVAFLEPNEEHHAWSVEATGRFRSPMLTCEPVVAEAMHLLGESPEAQGALLAWIATGRLAIDFKLADEVAAIRRSMRKYRDQPMSLADACLVRMAETFADHAVWTLDSDFRVYRKDGGAPIPLVIPDQA
jgi:predicted nucleic acid-binding protein